MKAFLLAAALFASLPVPAEEALSPVNDLKVSGSGEFWAYATAQNRTSDSPINPGNRVANLPKRQWTSEARFNFRLRSETTDIVLRPRLLEQRREGAEGQKESGDAYLSQGFVRLKLNDALTATAGRELLTWGPANFRSPSHPLYFDAGRTNPLREVSGVDLVRLNLTAGNVSATLARIASDGHLVGAVPTPTTLAKIDLRGEDAIVSAIVATPVFSRPFVGGFAQYTADEAWLLYGEIGSGHRPYVLTPASTPLGSPFTVQSPSPRKTTALLGASYTLLNGQSISAEALHDGHGFSRNASKRYFERAGEAASRAEAMPGSPLGLQALQSLRQGLGQAPALLGRDYLALLWQSNPQETGRYWRLMWTSNLQDRSHQVSVYYETSVSPRLSLFVQATRNLGGRDSEFGMLLSSQFTLGVKSFAF